MIALNRNAPAAVNSQGARNQASGHKFHVDHATAEPLLQRLDGVQKSGKGWRACCPACGGRSRKLLITEEAGRIGVHCFGCGDTAAILVAVGLSWADLMPPRNWPPSREERRAMTRARRESGWAAALSVVALEAHIALLAARELHLTGGLSIEDGKRLAIAVDRLQNAASVLVEVRG